MNLEEQGLIEAIRADPEDDAPRLVYADWLEDHGRHDPAELLRLQLSKEWSMERMQRQRALIDRLRGEWPAWLAAAGVRYRRGMGAVVWEDLNAAELGVAALAERTCPAWVVEGELSVYSTWGDRQRFQALVTSPAFAVVTHLMLWSGLSSEVLCLMARSPSAVNLCAIRLHEWKLSGKEASALADTGTLSRLRRLDLARCRFESGLQRLLESAALVQLRELNLDGALEEGDAAQAFPRAAGLPRLRALSLNSNGLGDRGLLALLRSPLLARLEGLSAAENGLSDSGAEALAECPAAAGLKRLDLGGNPVTDAGAQALLASLHLRRLRWLGLSGDFSGATRRMMSDRFGARSGGAG
jgi:uncharacterized protein (TIGR02996 family)